MRELMAPQLLEVWERGSIQSPAERALTLLAAAWPDEEELAGLSVGRRDGLLLSVRESAFGPVVTAITNCPDCSEELEIGFAIDDIRVPVPDTVAASASVAFNGYEVGFRLPNSRDLMIAGDAMDVETVRVALLRRCLLSARYQGEDVRPERLPDAVVEAVEEEMLNLDAQANVQIELQCPSCRREWTSAFDVLAFFWSELDAWAQRVLVEVHQLASAYGWSERDIIEMNPARRNLYLDLVGG